MKYYFDKTNHYKKLKTVLCAVLVCILSASYNLNVNASEVSFEFKVGKESYIFNSDVCRYEIKSLIASLPAQATAVKNFAAAKADYDSSMQLFSEYIILWTLFEENENEYSALIELARIKLVGLSMPITCLFPDEKIQSLFPLAFVTKTNSLTGFNQNIRSTRLFDEFLTKVDKVRKNRVSYLKWLSHNLNE